MARLFKEQLRGVADDFWVTLLAFRTRDGNDVINPQRHTKAIEARPEIRCACRNADANLFHKFALSFRALRLYSGQAPSRNLYLLTVRDVFATVDMTSKPSWIDKDALRVFESEGTNAHRICTAESGWVERFDRDVLISYKNDCDWLIDELQSWQTAVGFQPSRVFTRFLPKKNEERTTPKLVSGDAAQSLETVVTENSLNYGIDFGAGYSVGLFVDQRENRRFLREIKPKRLLNCFAYTCSFSVAAASVGARTVNVDLSKKSLQRGEHNFALNDLPATDHRFIADDVLSVLPRLARKGEKFDAIILDPPTFSRSHRGKVFHVERDFEDLLGSALETADRNCRVLISTNCTSLNENRLETIGRYSLKLARRAATFHRQPPPAEFPPGAGASTIWMTLR